MLEGRYRQSGPREDLHFENALLRHDPDNPDNWLVQFNRLHIPEAHGWHSMPKAFFRDVNRNRET